MPSCQSRKRSLHEFTFGFIQDAIRTTAIASPEGELNGIEETIEEREQILTHVDAMQCKLSLTLPR